jgi:broad specificity phosphatase PhoE
MNTRHALLTILLALPLALALAACNRDNDSAKISARAEAASKPMSEQATTLGENPLQATRQTATQVANQTGKAIDNAKASGAEAYQGLKAKTEDAYNNAAQGATKAYQGIKQGAAKAYVSARRSAGETYQAVKDKTNALIESADQAKQDATN